MQWKVKLWLTQKTTLLILTWYKLTEIRNNKYRRYKLTKACKMSRKQKCLLKSYKSGSQTHVVFTTFWKNTLTRVNTILRQLTFKKLWSRLKRHSYLSPVSSPQTLNTLQANAIHYTITVLGKIIFIGFQITIIHKMIWNHKSLALKFYSIIYK